MALRWAPLLAVAGALAAGYVLGLHDLLSLEALRKSQAGLAAHVRDHPILSAGVYVAVYIAAVAISFPGASFLTAVGGFMFGAALGAGLALFAATAGAVLIFLIARTSLGAALARRGGPRMRKLRDGLAKDGFNYLLFLRLVPIFPFWVVNLAAALFGMRLLPYVAATAIGIVPGTFVLAFFGHGLGTAIEAEGSPLSPALFLSLALLGVLALLPVLVRRRRDTRRRRDGAAPPAGR